MFTYLKSVLLLILATSSVYLTYGQESEKYLKLKESFYYREGFIQENDSTITKGLIKDYSINERKRHSVVTFVHANGTKKKYYPDMILRYGYSVYKFVSDKSIFYQVISEGRKVNLYKNLTISSTYSAAPGAPGMAGMGSTNTVEEFYVKKQGDTHFKLVRKRRFIEEFSEYFNDCPELVDMIVSKAYKYKDIRSIVSQYNMCE